MLDRCTERLLNFIGRRWSGLLGIAMILLGAYMIWIRKDYLGFAYILSQTVMIMFGIIMLMNPVKTVMNNVAIYALGLGLSRIIRSLPLLTDEHLIVFLAGCAVLFIGGSMVYTGYMFMQGKARGYRRMIYTASLAFFLMTYMVSLFGYSSLEEYVPVELDEGALLIESMLMCILYGILAFVLMDDRIRSRGYYEMVENDLLSTTEITNLPDSLTISERDADVLTDFSSPLWEKMDDDVPAEKQYVFDVIADRVVLVCIAQIWRGDARVHFTITANRQGTLLQALRFSADRLLPDEGGLTVASSDGFMARFVVEEAEA